MNEICVVRVDGVARGNPGPSGIGIVIEYPAGQVVRQIAEPLGVRTKNEAEYEAAIAGLRAARLLHARSILLMMDSELVARQLRGEYNVKVAKLRRLHVKAIRLIKGFDQVQIAHISRAYNRLADHLANDAIGERQAA